MAERKRLLRAFAPDLTPATQERYRDTAREDTETVLRHKAIVGLVGAVTLASSITLVLVSDLSTFLKILLAALGAGVGALVLLVPVVYVATLAAAPHRQRNQARAELRSVGSTKADTAESPPAAPTEVATDPSPRIPLAQRLRTHARRGYDLRDKIQADPLMRTMAPPENHLTREAETWQDRASSMLHDHPDASRRFSAPITRRLFFSPSNEGERLTRQLHERAGRLWQIADELERAEKIPNYVRDGLVRIIDQAETVKKLLGDVEYARFTIWTDRTAAFLDTVFGTLEGQRFREADKTGGTGERTLEDALRDRVARLRELRDQPEKWEIRVDEASLQAAFDAWRETDPVFGSPNEWGNNDA